MKKRYVVALVFQKHDNTTVTGVDIRSKLVTNVVEATSPEEAFGIGYKLNKKVVTEEGYKLALNVIDELVEKEIPVAVFVPQLTITFPSKAYRNVTELLDKMKEEKRITVLIEPQVKEVDAKGEATFTIRFKSNTDLLYFIELTKHDIK